MSKFINDFKSSISQELKGRQQYAQAEVISKGQNIFGDINTYNIRLIQGNRLVDGHYSDGEVLTNVPVNRDCALITQDIKEGQMVYVVFPYSDSNSPYIIDNMTEDVEATTNNTQPNAENKSNNKSEPTKDNLTYSLSGDCVWPVPDHFDISVLFGAKGKTSVHKGLDIPASTGSNIVTISKGTIIKQGWSDSYGNNITVDHGNGISSIYGHMSNFARKKGDNVNIGDVIGYIGSTGLSTGPHLHLEIREGDTKVNPYSGKYIPLVGKPRSGANVYI